MSALWIAIELIMPKGVRLDDEVVGLMSAALFEEGAQGVEHKDAEDPQVLVAAFPPEEAQDGLQAQVERALQELGVEVARIERRTFEDVDWSTHWQAHFHPLSFGRLWIVPSWLSPPDGAELVLRIDPSSAFGTGLHETTALCLERILSLDPPARILDVGTGTGVLAMAALLSGSQQALGIDNDPEAIKVAKENAEINGLDDRLALSERIPSPDEGRYSLVVANILAGPLIELAPTIAPLVEPKGRLLLSGILLPQAKGVQKAYEAQGLIAAQTKGRGEWALIELMAR